MGWRKSFNISLSGVTSGELSKPLACSECAAVKCHHLSVFVGFGVIWIQWNTRNKKIADLPI